MKLILARHGIAMEREEAFLKGIDDSKRPLIEKGRERVRAMAKVLKKLEPNLGTIVTSPYVRAEQTAEIYCEPFKIKEMHRCPDLIPSASAESTAVWLHSRLKTSDSVLVVGHDPHLGLFASWLLGGSFESFIDVKKNSLMVLEVESLQDLAPKSAILKSYLVPKLFD